MFQAVYWIQQNIRRHAEQTEARKKVFGTKTFLQVLISTTNTVLLQVVKIDELMRKD